MTQRRPAAHSYLFTVRVWWEDLGQGQQEWRGVVKLVTSGEEHFFRDWVTLGELIERMTPNLLTETALRQEEFGD
ncbi:MAG: hypothetical protein DYG89_17945 [Caldilinea sp. CFX5]|nr:hypothetical protein [Caldilinea sp. CFX5]